MKIFYTEQALESLQDCLDFLSIEHPPGKVMEIRDKIIFKTEKLKNNPFVGQREEHLLHLGLDHRRIVEGNYKIIYRD